MQSRDSAREIFISDSSSHRERAPLLSSRRGGVLQSQSASMSTSSNLLMEPSHFNWQREKLRCKKMFYNRVPKGKAVFVVFLVNLLESFAFHGALNLIRFSFSGVGTTAERESDFLFTILYFTVGRVFYPFAGLIADVYVGRYRVIHAGLWMFFVGFVTILIGMSCEWFSNSFALKVPAIVATVLFMLGSASVESTIIPFGVDQIQQGASSDEISSYFSWYYFGRNLGYFLNILTSFVVYVSVRKVNDDLGWTELNANSSSDQVSEMEHTITNSLAGFFALAGLMVAMLLHYCCQFYRARHRENPIRTICNVLCFAATVKRHAPRYRRSFRYGEERKSRIELAKIEFDGIYSSEEVEDVKTFFRILFLVLSLGGCFATFGALSGMYSYITTGCSRMSGSYFELVNGTVIILFIPLLNNVFLPCVPGTSIKRRVGVGIFFFLLSTVVGTVINWREDTSGLPSAPLLWLTIPIVVMSLGDALVFISGLEFIYAQSPDSMKGLLTGLFYFIFGSFNAVGTAVFWVMSNKEPSHDHSHLSETTSDLHCSQLYIDSWFYYITLMICGLGFVVYVVVSACYKNRQRPTNDESEKEILHRSIATSVYLSHRPA